MTSKEQATIIQCLMDYLDRECNNTGNVPATEQMDAYLFKGFGVVFENEYLEELRGVFIELKHEDENGWR